MRVHGACGYARMHVSGVGCQVAVSARLVRVCKDHTLWHPKRHPDTALFEGALADELHVPDLLIIN